MGKKARLKREKARARCRSKEPKRFVTVQQLADAGAFDKMWGKK